MVARNAVKRGLVVKKYVKTSLAPGSRVPTEYLTRSGLLTDLEKLGFGVSESYIIMSIRIMTCCNRS